MIIVSMVWKEPQTSRASGVLFGGFEPVLRRHQCLVVGRSEYLDVKEVKS